MAEVREILAKALDPDAFPGDGLEYSRTTAAFRQADRLLANLAKAGLVVVPKRLSGPAWEVFRQYATHRDPDSELTHWHGDFGNFAFIYAAMIAAGEPGNG